MGQDGPCTIALVSVDLKDAVEALEDALSMSATASWVRSCRPRLVDQRRHDRDRRAGQPTDNRSVLKNKALRSACTFAIDVIGSQGILPYVPTGIVGLPSGQSYRRPLAIEHGCSVASREPLESERKALLAMRRMQKAGKSLRAIATAMQERGLAFSHQGVKKALARVGEGA